MYILLHANLILRPLKHAEKESKNLAVFEDYLVSKMSYFSFIKSFNHVSFKFSLSPRTPPSIHCPL